MKRILSLWLPRLTTDRIVRRRPELADRPLVAVFNERGRLVVAAVNRTAELEGIAPGQSLSDARALLPETVAAEADPAGDARALARLADWCGRYTPWAAVDQSACPGSVQGGGLWLDISGCAHLSGGEAGLNADLLNRLGGFGLTARAGIADTPGAAWAWARFGDPARPSLESGTQPDALAPLPVQALRLAPADAETLVRLGLRRIGDLYRIPRASLAARFGEGIRQRLDQALGNTREPISPVEQKPPCEVRQAFGEPFLTPEAVRGTLADLLARLRTRLEREGLGARRLVYSIYRIDGAVLRATVGTSRPARDPAHLMQLFAPRLELLDPEPGIELATLGAPLTALFEETQTRAALASTLEGEPASSEAHKPQAEEAAQLADRLVNRLGDDRVGRMAARESHLPEARSRFHPATAPAPSWGNWPHGMGASLRLFSRPESLEAPASLGESAPHRFVWRRNEHRTARAEGPERLLGDWWRGDGTARDYYRVEDVEGRGFWLYRDLETRRWYIHGLLG